MSNDSPTILVVDDEASVRRVISLLLESQGYSVKSADCMKNALEMLDNNNFDLIVTDHIMNGGTGLDLIIEANKRHPDIVKLLLTGYGDRALYRDAINRAAVFSVIEKPADPESMFDVIKKALEYRFKRLEEKIEIENIKEQYHNIFEHTTDLIQCYDTQGNFIYVNPAWHDTLGYNEIEVKNIKLDDILHPDYDVEKLAFSETDKENKGPFDIILIAKDGRDVYIEGTSTVQTLENGIFTTTSFLRDVTEKKRANDEIRARLEQETMIARIANILASTAEPVFVYDEILEIFGHTINVDRAFIYAINEVDKVINKISVWHSPDREIQRDMDTVIAFSDIPWSTKKIERGETVIVCSTNNNKDTECPFCDLFSSDSALILPITVSSSAVGILGFSCDKEIKSWNDQEIRMLSAASDILANAWTRQVEIDFRKQKELEVEQSRLLVIRADRLAALGTMTAGIIHEITQPLNAMNVSTQTIMYGMSRGWTLESEQVQSSLTLISEQIKRMTEIITNMRLFARDSAPAPKKADKLNPQIERISTIIGEQMKAHDIQMELDFGDIPDTLMNTHLILQVILNLITNARQSLDELDYDQEREEKKILIRTYFDDEHVILEVSDNGTGITEDVRNKIFDPFFTTKEVGKGTGLGLSISATIVQEHNGELDTFNNEMGGATFVMKLPLISEAGETA